MQEWQDQPQDGDPPRDLLIGGITDEQSPVPALRVYIDVLASIVCVEVTGAAEPDPTEPVEAV